MPFEDRPVVLLDLLGVDLGNLANEIASLVDRTPLRRDSGKTCSKAAIKPEAPSETPSRGDFSLRALRLAKWSCQAS